jgi:hypothetical protein
VKPPIRIEKVRIEKAVLIRISLISVEPVLKPATDQMIYHGYPYTEVTARAGHRQLWLPKP